MKTNPPRNPQTDLERAVETLKALNTLADAKGRRLSDRVVFKGTKTWYLRQEELFWNILVPYVENKEEIDAFLAGDKGRRAPVSARSVSVLGRLGIVVDGPSALRRAVRRIRPLLAVAALSLISVFSALYFRLRRFDTVLYALDKISPGLRHDFRIDPIYREGEKRGYRLAEYVFHTDGVFKGIGNIFKRRRPFVSVESPAALLTQGSGAPRSEPSMNLPKTAVASASPAFVGLCLGWLAAKHRFSVREIQCLRILLRIQKARRAVVLDDSRFANELVAACRLEGIPVLGYMHGLLNRHHPGLMGYGFAGTPRHTFSAYGFWSPYFQKRVLAGRLYTSRTTFAMGPLRPPSADEWRRCRRSPRRTRPPFRVLLVSEPRVHLHEVIPYAEALASNPDVALTIKTRPGENVGRLRRRLPAGPNRIRLIEGGTVYSAFADADVVVGAYSTVLYEAALVLRPATVLKTSFSYGLEIVDDGLAEYAPSPSALPRAIQRSASQPESELVRRREAIWGSDGFASAAPRLFDFGERHLWPNRPPR